MKNNTGSEFYAKNDAINKISCANKSSKSKKESRKPLCPRNLVSLLCVLALIASCGVLLSSCTTIGGAIVYAAKNAAGDPKFENCTEMFGTTACNIGFTEYDSGDEELSFSKDLQQKLKNQNLTGDESTIALANAKMQDLPRLYSEVQKHCQYERFDTEKCMGYGVNSLLKARENAYLLRTAAFLNGSGQSSVYTEFESNNNRLVVPENDDVYMTAQLQGYYDALSDEAKALVDIDNIAMTADKLRLKKMNQVTMFIANFAIYDTLPVGESVPELEPLVVDYIKKLNPDLKIQNIVFNPNWLVRKKFVETGLYDHHGNPVKEEKITHKARYAVITVEDPLDATKSAVLGYRVFLRMEYEGSGYGEPFVASLQHILPVNHKIDMYSDEGYVNIDGYYASFGYNSHIVDYDNKQVLYNYHAQDIFIRIRPSTLKKK